MLPDFVARLPGNALIALAAAASWGGGDFSGGMGAKTAGGATRGALRVIVLAHAVSLVVLLAIAYLHHDSLLHGAPVAWALGAGVAAGLSLTAFYVALASGDMGASAAISGLLAAAIPVAISFLIEGRPGRLQALGFVLAGVAIWIIAAAPSHLGGNPPSRRIMGLAILGGVGFGIYFAALRMANPLGAVEPVTLARIGSLFVCLVLLLVVSRKTTPAGGPWLNRTAVGWALGVAVLDTGGNLLFVTATRWGRLDVAAVLASLYPASTILLAAWKLHERPTPRQLVGMGLALAAVVMITL
ncbi:MAG TPA: DMT family transporter [Acidobacteriaceae bacterium]